MYRTRIEDEILNPDIHYLGTPCKRGHIHENTGKTKRYKSNKNCVLCHASNTRKYVDGKTKQKQERKAKNLKQVRKAKMWATINCARYRKCLDETCKIKEEMKCHKCEEVMQNEKGTSMP